MSESTAARQPLAEKGDNAQNIGISPIIGIKRTQEIFDDDSDGDHPVTQTCDQVRNKLRRFIDTGEMKLGELHNALGVSGKSFNTFMNHSGKMGGASTATYPAAFEFFRKREAKGIKIPAKKRAKKSEEMKQKTDLSDVALAGEQNTSVPVFDTCDEVRKKIRAHLKHPGITQAGFCRDIASTYPDQRKIQPSQMQTFLGQHGAIKGCTSGTYYAAYVYFEKLRIKEGKPKSNHRVEMEKRHGAEGVDTKHKGDYVLCGPNDRPSFDRYGCLQISRVGGFH